MEHLETLAFSDKLEHVRMASNFYALYGKTCKYHRANTINTPSLLAIFHEKIYDYVGILEDSTQFNIPFQSLSQKNQKLERLH